MFEITYTPRYGDYKDFDTLKTGSILDMVQDASITHSNTLGYTIHRLRDLNIAWLMQGINLEIVSPLRADAPIKILTSVCSMKGASSERGCLITQNGETIAKTVANWFTFDTEKLRPCRVPKEIAGTYPIHDFEDDFFVYRKPEILTFDKADYTITVRNKDLDTNRHLNNQKSAEMLLDALSFDWNFRLMKVFYKTPAFLGDELGVCVKEIENGYYVHLQKDDGTVCVAGEFTV